MYSHTSGSSFGPSGIFALRICAWVTLLNRRAFGLTGACCGAYEYSRALRRSGSTAGRPKPCGTLSFIEELGDLRLTFTGCPEDISSAFRQFSTKRINRLQSQILHTHAHYCHIKFIEIFFWQCNLWILSYESLELSIAWCLLHHLSLFGKLHAKQLNLSKIKSEAILYLSRGDCL